MPVETRRNLLLWIIEFMIFPAHTLQPWWRNHLDSWLLFARQSDQFRNETVKKYPCGRRAARHSCNMHRHCSFDHIVNIFALLLFSYKPAWNLVHVRNDAFCLRACLSCKELAIQLMCCSVDKYASLHVAINFMTIEHIG